MTKRSNFWAEYAKPVIVLTVICLIISAALAFTDNVTAPIIAESERAAAEAARLEVLPDADSFTEVELEALPETITAVYKAENGAGYVFMITCDGYGGAKTMKLICGIDGDGLITASRTLSNKETAGVGTKTTERPFYEQFTGQDSSLSGVDVITGASYSSNYYINAIRDAFTAYEMVKEAEA